MVNYWLLKTEPETFSIDDLAKVKREPWDGIRNYQARNFIRDQMAVGDQVFIYHSNCEVPGIMGLAEVVSPAYADHTAFDPEANYFDPKSDPANPRWMMVDVAYQRHLKRTISLRELKTYAEGPLMAMPLVRKANRLSVMPVSSAQWAFILSLE